MSLSETPNERESQRTKKETCQFLEFLSSFSGPSRRPNWTRNQLITVCDRYKFGDSGNLGGSPELILSRHFFPKALVDCLLMFLCRFSVRCRRILGFGGRCRLRLGPAAINLNVIYNSFGPFHCGVLFSVGSSMDGAE